MGGNSTGYLQGDIKNLQLIFGGETKLQAKITNGNTIAINSGGSSNINLSGKVNALTITVAGNTTINAQGLSANSVVIKGAGNADITVNVIKTLAINTIGVSTIKYYGNPAVSKNTLGESSVTKLG